jgi:two-component system, response regulator
MANPFILVVEDNPDHLELAVETFRDVGVTVPIEVARDGVEALDFLFARGAHVGRPTDHQPAFVMLDIKLPRLSGIDVLRQMRDNPLTAIVPVIMLTSSTERSDMQTCYEAGANSFVHKSFDFALYTEKLQCLQAYWLDVNQGIETDSMFVPLIG